MVRVALLSPSTKASTSISTAWATVTAASARLPSRLPTHSTLTSCIEPCSRLATRIGSANTISLRGIDPWVKSSLKAAGCSPGAGRVRVGMSSGSVGRRAGRRPRPEGAGNCGAGSPYGAARGLFQIRGRTPPDGAAAPGHAFSARVLHPGRNAVDGGEQGPQQLIVAAAFRAPAAQQLHLQQADRIDVRIAQADRHAQAIVVGEQFVLALDSQYGLAGALELLRDAREERLVRVAGQARVALEDVQVRLGQQHFHVVQQGGEER